MAEPTVRCATAEDAPACAAIYTPYVTDTAISLEEVPPSPAEMAARIDAAHEWLVAVEQGEVRGYAYAGRFAPRAGYRWSTEVSVYVGADHRGSGLGRMLYSALLPRLADRGYHVAFAGMTVPNPGSERLHRAFGFTVCGTYRRAGRKFGAWHDVQWMQRELAPADGTVDEPR